MKEKETESKDSKKEDDKKENKKKKASAKVDEEEKEDAKKSLGKFMTLQDIDLCINKGEFLCIIGDVGSGKSSLLNAIIGDLIYVPSSSITEFGGLEHTATSEELDKLKEQILGDNFSVEEAPVNISGSLSFVEQNAWI